MPTIALAAMRDFLSRSLDSRRAHRAAVAAGFRAHVRSVGFSERISAGGWILRNGPNGFAQTTAALFPECVLPSHLHEFREIPSNSPCGLHGTCLCLYESGIAGFYCAATIDADDDPSTHRWTAVQLGLPVQQQYQPLADALAPLNFRTAQRAYNSLRYHTDTESIPDSAVPEEYSKEHLRVARNTAYQAEISDVNGIFCGQQHTYAIEIEEKTAAPSGDMGPYFGLDVGPFVKLAFYAAKRGNLHSLYVVREIDNPDERNLVQWWVIKFDQLAQFASWVFRSGGQAMGGGASAVVRAPRSEFQKLNGAVLAGL